MRWLRPAERIRVQLQLAADETLPAEAATRRGRVDTAARRLHLLRQALGTTVFSGMIGVTLFGLIFTPAFYVMARWIAQRTSRHRPEPNRPELSGTAPAE